MKFSFTKKTNIPKHKKDGRINPHRFMILFMSGFLIVLTVEILLFTYLFISSSKKMDTEVAPKPNTNIGQIEKIEKIIEKTEKAVSERQSVSSPSQNTTPIVQ